ncbi:MAG: hypothetical protein MR821_09785, partial [Clostridiales bacterium]|nr:hypothetical protein [Clostridiales bacterium]
HPALKLLFLLNNKGTLGCRPSLLEGFHPSNSLLRFALIFELLSARQYDAGASAPKPREPSLLADRKESGDFSGRTADMIFRKTAKRPPPFSFSLAAS